MTERETVHVAELLGDGISPELSAAVHRIAAALPIDVRFHEIDLSLAARERQGESAYDAAVAAIKAHGVAM